MGISVQLAGKLKYGTSQISQHDSPDSMHLGREGATYDMETTFTAQRITLNFTDGSKRLFLTVRKDEKLDEHMHEFAIKTGTDLVTLRFIFDGQRIGPDQTPLELDMGNGDVVEVHTEQRGCGCGCGGRER